MENIARYFDIVMSGNVQGHTYLGCIMPFAKYATIGNQGFAIIATKA
jgi:hypothetical protein